MHSMPTDLLGLTVIGALLVGRTRTNRIRRAAGPAVRRAFQ